MIAWSIAAAKASGVFDAVVVSTDDAEIAEVAVAHGVPIVERPPLARELFHNVEVGKAISAEQYEAVAEVLAYVYRLERQIA